MFEEIIEYSEDIKEWSVMFISTTREKHLMSYKKGLSDLEDLYKLVNNMIPWKIEKIIFPNEK